MMFFSSNKGDSDTKKTVDKNDPIAQGKEWKRSLQKEIRKMDRDIQNIKRAEQKSMKECQALAKKNRTGAVKILAKEIVNTRRTIDRMYTSKAQLNSVCNQLQTSMSMVKMQGCISKSAEIMGVMNELVNIKEMRETMMNMAREMERSGLIDEIVGDAMESMEPAGLDAEADAEADKIIAELMAGTLAPASAAPQGAIAAKASTAAGGPSQVQATAAAATEEEDAAAAADNAALLARLQAL